MLDSIKDGTRIPSVTSRIERIAKENGIEVTGQTRPEDIVNALRKIQQSYKLEVPSVDSVIVSDTSKEQTLEAKELLKRVISDPDVMKKIESEKPIDLDNWNPNELC